ncbi:CHASE2 domain-containing protein [Hydrogenophilus thiooxidans]|uniref:CHASE2 domain-containing protein n=1 Tax=Hydrogenophilus thiooxidans TaxID=2820326 RepID=UPI001C242374|nr:CHASE2 domain-containing protein [Hydrogenophilus thiooxidans]
MAALTPTRQLLAAALAALLALILGHHPLPGQQRLADHLDALLPPLPPHPQLVVIDIDERSLATLGPWPWPRELQAQLITKLRAAGVQKQIWDILWTDDRPLPPPFLNALGPDITAATLLILDPNVPSPPHEGAPPNPPTPCAPSDPQALGYRFPPRPLLERGVALGHITPTFDSDGLLRRLPTYLCAAQSRIPALAAAAAAPAAPLPETLYLVRQRPPAAWPVLPADLILADAVSPARLNGRIALIGSTALGVADRIPTPRSPTTPGLAVHAEILNALLHQTPPSPSHPYHLALLTFFALAPFAYRPLRPLLPLAPLLAAAGELLAAHLSVAPLTAAPLLASAAALALLGLTAAIVTVRERRQLAAQLAALLPPPLRAAPLKSVEPLPRDDAWLLALELRNFDHWRTAHDLRQPLLVAEAVAHALTAPFAADDPLLFPQPNGRTLLLLTPADPATLPARMVTLADQLQAALDALDAAQLTVALALHRGPLLIGRLGHRPATWHLLGPTVEEAQALLTLCADWAQRALITSATQLTPPPPWRDLGPCLLPDRAAPLTLYGYPGSAPAP